MAAEEKPETTEQVGRRTAMRYAFWGIVAAALTALTWKKAEAGWGQCSVSGCPCQGYYGNQALCGNCGHQYGAHW
jgi:hypothetical protein